MYLREALEVVEKIAYIDDSGNPVVSFDDVNELIHNIYKTMGPTPAKPKKDLVTQVPAEYSNINQEAFNEWIAYKKYKNKGAITKTLKMMNKYDYQTQQEMVDKSIMNEYKGLFEPKQKRSNTDNNVNAAMSWAEKNETLHVDNIKVINHVG